jgi:hypothetical protein
LKTFSANKTFEYRSGKDIAYSAKKTNVNRVPNLGIKSSGAVVGSILIDGTAGEVLISYVCCMQFNAFSNPLTEKKNRKLLAKIKRYFLTYAVIEYSKPLTEKNLDLSPPICGK